MGTIQITPGQPGCLDTPESLEHVRSLFTSDRIVVAAAMKAALTELSVARVQEIVTALDAELTLRGYYPRTRHPLARRALAEPALAP